jgi:hypothetical protein
MAWLQDMSKSMGLSFKGHLSEQRNDRELASVPLLPLVSTCRLNGVTSQSTGIEGLSGPIGVRTRVEGPSRPRAQG